jgi:uncharacterized Fe-S center protein
MKRLLLSVALCLFTFSAYAQNGEKSCCKASDKAKVYFVEDITPESLVKIYKALGREATGKVGVKISTGEQGGNNYLKPELIKDLVKLVKGNIVECNTAYGGSRQETDKHRQTIANHGFDKIAKVDIMDEFGEASIAVPAKSQVLKKDIVGKSMLDYDFLVVLNHFKGHAMGGFGGALKNLSIGCASTNGKAYIHSAGRDEVLGPETWHSHIAGLDEFKDAMAEAAGAVVNHFGDKILYISVVNNLSVDCDCDAHPAEPKMKDVGIVASLDPVALDQACVDMVFNSPDKGNRDLVERIVSRHGTRILYWAQYLGYGSRDYELIHVK